RPPGRLPSFAELPALERKAFAVAARRRRGGVRTRMRFGRGRNAPFGRFRRRLGDADAIFHDLAGPASDARAMIALCPFAGRTDEGTDPRLEFVDRSERLLRHVVLRQAD